MNNRYGSKCNSTSARQNSMDQKPRELLGRIARTMAECVAQLKTIPPSRETALAITNAETAVMWINKASGGAEHSGEGMIIT